uniref:Uncharacterized protein n=1 Tax=Siphoviridae sp. ctx254 TaxID=2825737 RepID=A0A8S5TVN6_9CAUD|nr:MAG TPA: hypothetical protein [Siphoviridae sp. ctx254]
MDCFRPFASVLGCFDPREKYCPFYGEERVRPKRATPLSFWRRFLCWKTDSKQTW